MSKPTRPLPAGQRGIAVWLIVVLVVVVVAAVVGAAAVATSTPSMPPPSSGSSSAPAPGEPPPGCLPAGTQCRVFIQNVVSCCGGQPVVGPRVGVCFGWYDALPCR